MKEIEVKARINNMDSVKDTLEGFGCNFYTVVQKDVVFFKDGIKPKIGLGIPAFRIREESGSKNRILLTLKIPELNELDKIEKEIEIQDSETTKQMLELIGFKETIKLNKTRMKAQFNDYEICLDSVEGLGEFIEIEKITNEDAERVQDELFSFLETLGIAKEDRILESYDTMLHRKSTS